MIGIDQLTLPQARECVANMAKQIAELAAAKKVANERVRMLNLDLVAEQQANRNNVASRRKQIADLTTNINVQQREHESLLNDLQGEKDTLTRKLDLAEAGCVVYRRLLADALPHIECTTTDLSGLITAIGNLLNGDNTGQALAARLAELERLDAAVQDDIPDAVLDQAEADGPDALTFREALGFAIDTYRKALNEKKENPDGK